MISLIVAAAENGVIGKEGGLPWYLPAELKRFKETTMGHPIIMGRKTHESIGRALPGRSNIVISRDKGYPVAEGALLARDLKTAIETAKGRPGGEEIFVIGGESIYKLALPLANRIFLTEVKAIIEGDKYFKFDKAAWREVSSAKHEADEKNQYAFEFKVLEKAK